MGPVSRSAFEVYQQLMRKRAKKYEKKAKKQRLQSQFSVADMNESSNVSLSQNKRAQIVGLDKNSTGRTDVVKAKTKALKRLSAGTSRHANVDFQSPATKLRKKVNSKSSNGSLTDEDPAGKKARNDSGKKAKDGLGKKARDDSGKKARDDSGKKARDDSGKKARDDSGKKARDDSGKKARDDSGKKARGDSGKKACDDSDKKAKDGLGKEARDDSGKKACDDSGKKACDDSGKKARDDSGKKACDDSGKKACDDSGKKTKDDSNEKARVDPGVKLNGFAKIPFKSLRRPVIDDSDSSSEEETPPKRTEKSRQGKKAKVEIGKIPDFLEDESIPIENSTQSGRDVLEWLITPIRIQPFLEKYWEKRPLFISRAYHRNFLKGILSSEDIDTALRENSMQFTKNVDVTTYVNGVRETHNPVGRAHAFTVWDYYRNGCSVRILNPQTYFKKLRKICTILQECFNSFVGANVYLTPPNSQGFAPHYDDIEAFVLQLEGKKKWKVYKPRKTEILARVSSRNFTEEELEQPLLEIELQPGDLLYMPRGYTHQACTVPDTHSLHVTISTYQHSSWADVMEKILQGALEIAVECEPEFREGIPWDFLSNMGITYSTDNTDRRTQIFSHMKRLFLKLLEHTPIDGTADQMAKDFLHESLPPMLQSSEVGFSVHGNGEKMKGGDVGCAQSLTLNSSVKLIRQNVMRLVSEGIDDTVKVYHCAENPLVYREDDPKWFEIEVEMAPAFETLIRNYPEYTRVEDLPCDDDYRKVQMVMAMWERGMLLSKEPIMDIPLTED